MSTSRADHPPNLVSMLWPERSPPTRPTATAPGSKPTIEYGIRLGAAGATAAAIGFLLNLEHVGWACAAALLVMRPNADMQRLRSAGRIFAVAAGALAGAGLVRLHPAAAIYSLAVIAVIAAAGATHRSRWYVTAAFTTFLVFLLLLYSEPQTATKRFNERVLETLLGVAIAYFYGLAVPALAERERGVGA
ncbi:MAG: FUSC family protein [Solirubrobacteraceae bacterium]